MAYEPAADADQCAFDATESGDGYVRDRVNVPRDMPLYSARAFCKALEETAALDSNALPRSTIPVKHRRDQNPQPFQHRDRAACVSA